MLVCMLFRLFVCLFVRSFVCMFACLLLLLVLLHLGADEAGVILELNCAELDHSLEVLLALLATCAHDACIVFVCCFFCCFVKYSFVVLVVLLVFVVLLSFVASWVVRPPAPS